MVAWTRAARARPPPPPPASSWRRCVLSPRRARRRPTKCPPWAARSSGSRDSGVDQRGITRPSDIGLTGFPIPEIDSLIEGLEPEEPGAPEEDILPADGPARCRPGDLWQLGPHRLICG